MNRYIELYAWMWRSFGRDKFTMDEFRSTFPTSQAPKVISDLVAKGYIYRVSRGNYRITEPGEFIRKISDQEPDERVLDDVRKSYAFCESTAVAIWTDGYYWTGFTRGFKPMHVAVNGMDIEPWKLFLKKSGVRFVLDGERRTLYGIVYVLHPRKSVQVVEVDGTSVVPLEEVVNFCLDREIAYEPALEYLDEKYQIGYTRREALYT